MPFIVKTYVKQRQQDCTDQQFWSFLPEAGLYSILFRLSDGHKLPKHVMAPNRPDGHVIRPLVTYLYILVTAWNHAAVAG